MDRERENASMKTLRVGLSPCPNDTFIFHALLEGFVELEDFHLEPVFEDVETLNVMARNGELEITKISFHAYGHLRDTYKLLQAGAALGRGCGPLIVVREGDEERDLSTAKIAIPGKLTSANLLLRLFAPRVPAGSLIEMTFDRIMDAVKTGEVDAGLIIHESRFTYGELGLRKLADLGDWWEETHGYPIPLGGIIARPQLQIDGPGLLHQVRVDRGAQDILLLGVAAHLVKLHGLSSGNNPHAAIGLIAHT